MEQKKYKVKRGGWGGFFLFLFGMLMGIIAVGLFGLWAYKNVSIEKTERWFKYNIDLGDANGIKSMTIEQLIALGVDYGNRSDTLTLNDVKDDFGISLPDKIQGISIKSLKSVPLKEIGNNFNLVMEDEENTLAVFANVFGFNLPDINIINNNSGKSVSKPFGAIFDVMNKCMNLTIADLEDFGIDFSTVNLLNNLADTTKLSELETEIKAKTVGEFIEIGESSSAVLKAIKDIAINDLSTELPKLSIGTVIGDTTTTTGIIGAIKDLTIGDLSETAIKDKIQNVKLSEMMTINESSNAILRQLANSTISSLSNDIDNINISIVMGDNNVVKLLKNKNGGQNVTLSQLPHLMSTAFKVESLTVGDLGTLGFDITGLNENMTVKSIIEEYKSLKNAV